MMGQDIFPALIRLKKMFSCGSKLENPEPEVLRPLLPVGVANQETNLLNLAHFMEPVTLQDSHKVSATAQKTSYFEV